MKTINLRKLFAEAIKKSEEDDDQELANIEKEKDVKQQALSDLEKEKDDFEDNEDDDSNDNKEKTEIPQIEKQPQSSKDYADSYPDTGKQLEIKLGDEFKNEHIKITSSLIRPEYKNDKFVLELDIEFYLKIKKNLMLKHWDIASNDTKLLKKRIGFDYPGFIKEIDFTYGK